MWTIRTHLCSWVRSNRKRFGVASVLKGVRLVPFLYSFVAAFCSMTSLHAEYVQQGDRFHDQFSWNNVLYRDYEGRNRAFLTEHNVDSLHYQDTQCQNSDPSFLRMRDIEAACSRWIGDALRLPWCVRLLSVSHCLHVGNGIDESVHRLGLEGEKDSVFRKGMIERALLDGRGPTQIYAFMRDIVDHKQFFEQFGALGVDTPDRAREMDIDVIRHLGCKMRRRGEFSGLLQELRCKK